MGERKVLNKYIPPDFDPSILPKFKRDRSKLMEIRMMLPFSLRCNMCSEFMYKGKKFNSKTEIVKGEDYLGIRKIRFFIKCTVCSNEIAFKTDPKNSDYECEWGASRNFEVWRDNDVALAEAAKVQEEEEKNDAMKSLENRTLDSKIEMDMLDALDEIKAINQRHERVDTEVLLEKNHQDRKRQLQAAEEEDEKVIKSINFKSTGPTNAPQRSLAEQVATSLSNSKSDLSLRAESGTSTVIIKKRKLPPKGATTAVAKPASVAADSSSSSANAVQSDGASAGGLAGALK